MRLNRRQAFGLAGIIALVVAVLVYYALTKSITPQQVQQPQIVPVVVALTNIPSNTTITPGMVEVKQVPAATAPSNALTTTGEAVGRVAQYTIAAGQLLVRGDVVEGGRAQGLTFVIPKGKRAVTVALDPISGVGGFVVPGDRVDILATFDQDEVSSTARMILQNIEVLAMNDQTVRPKNGSATPADQGTATEAESPVVEQVKSATLAVTPEEAQRLILAAYKGAIHMVLRARDDMTDIAQLPATTDYALMGFPGPVSKPPEEPAPVQQPPPGWPMGYAQPPTAAPAPAAPTAPSGPTIEVIRGTEHEIVTPDH